MLALLGAGVHPLASSAAPPAPRKWPCARRLMSGCSLIYFPFSLFLRLSFFHWKKEDYKKTAWRKPGGFVCTLSKSGFPAVFRTIDTFPMCSTFWNAACVWLVGTVVVAVKILPCYHWPAARMFEVTPCAVRIFQCVVVSAFRPLLTMCSHCDLTTFPPAPAV